MGVLGVVTRPLNRDNDGMPLVSPRNVTHIPPWTITINQDQIPVYSNSPTPDKTWTFIDAAGHGHFYGSYALRGKYPTLVWVAEGCDMGHDEDCEGEGHWECPHCGEEIVPGLNPPPTGPTYIKGPVDAWGGLRRRTGATAIRRGFGG